MLDVHGVHHIALTVTDLDRAKAFYSGVLGLRELPRPDFPFPGAWYQLGDRQLHLVVHPPTRTLRGTREIDPRDGHFAVRVGRYDEAVAHFRAHGVPVREQHANPTPWAQLYVTDPDGNVIELNAERQVGG
jgi:catechol 2,3-dioxygenase-like lactoylglutathione lyase family enzyme